MGTTLLFYALLSMIVIVLYLSVMTSTQLLFDCNTVQHPINAIKGTT